MLRAARRPLLTDTVPFLKYLFCLRARYFRGFFGLYRGSRMRAARRFSCCRYAGQHTLCRSTSEECSCCGGSSVLFRAHAHRSPAAGTRRSQDFTSAGLTCGCSGTDMNAPLRAGVAYPGTNGFRSSCPRRAVGWLVTSFRSFRGSFAGLRESSVSGRPSRTRKDAQLTRTCG